MLVFTGRPCRCPCAAPVLPLCRPTPTSRLYPSLCCWGLCLRSPSSFSLGCWGPCLRDSASSSLCCWGLGLCAAAASSLCCWGPCLRDPASSSLLCWGLGLCVAAASDLCCWGPCLRDPAPSVFLGFEVDRGSGKCKKKACRPKSRRMEILPLAPPISMLGYNISPCVNIDRLLIRTP